MEDSKFKILVYYHNDPDGICSAAIVRRTYDMNKYDVECIPVNYGDTWDLDSVRDAYQVFVLDFAFHDMYLIEATANYLVWIDHHQSAKDKYPAMWVDPDMPGIRSTEKAACELTWDYAGSEYVCPQAVEYIADRDMWKFEHKDTKYFTAAFSVMVKDPTNDYWDLLLENYDDVLIEFINIGKVLLMAQEDRIKKAIDRGTDFSFNGLRARLVNSSIDISEIGEAIYKDPNYDIAVIWFADNDIVRFSLRANKESPVDCAKIAEKYGGGGHPKAAGFQLNSQDFPFIFGLTKHLIEDPCKE